MSRDGAVIFFGSRTAVSTLLALVLSGCATEMTFRHREALDSFVGKDRSFLIERLGTPTNETQQGALDLLTYDYHQFEWNPGEPGALDVSGEPEGPLAFDARCATTFRITAGRVDAWRLKGNQCRDGNFPPVDANVQQALREATERGVDSVAKFPHDSFTGRSVVNYGEFQNN
jgi:hypothetical protein